MGKKLKVQLGQHRTLRAHVKPDASLLRVETLRNSEYAVTPAVILVEGVIQGAMADTPELALSSEFGKIPEAWNGRPVVVNHPKRNSQFVPAGIPDVWEQEVIGWLFNTVVEDSRLKTELWVNKEWMEDSGYSEIKANVEEAKTMEVSTGLFADVEEVSGIWNGEQYEGVWRNVVPDHLAILENSPGACSVEDGCGTSRLNVQSPQSTQSEGGCCMSTSNDNADRKGPGFLARLLNFVSTVKSNSTDMNTGDQFAAASSALGAVEKDFYVVAVYDDRVIYEVYDQSAGWRMKQRSMSISSDGQVSIGSEAIEVMPVTDFVPVKITVTSTTDTPETPEAPEPVLEANAGTAGTAGDTSDEEIPQSPTAEPLNGKTVTDTQVPELSTQEPEPEPTPAPEPTSTVVEEHMTLQSFLAKADKSEASRVQAALQVFEAQRSDLIKQILGSETNAFSETELRAMSHEQLQKVNALATKTNYTGSLGQPEVRGTADERFNAPVLAFPRKTA